MRSLIIAAALAAATVAVPSFAEVAGIRPDPAAVQPWAIPEPVDASWPGGTMQLDIDASDTLRGVFRVTQTIPLPTGMTRLTLLLPEWLPGNHAPRGPVAELVDLKFSSSGQSLGWRRDPLDVHAFHVDLPAGAREVVARFIHTSPLERDEGRITMTPEMLNLQWEKMSLYPAGHYVSRVPVRPSVTLPSGWTAAAALDGQKASGNRVSWAATDYETLVDSPVFAGAHFRRWDLGRGVGLNVVADAPELIDLKDRHLATLAALAPEAEAVFGPPPYDRYEFLVALSERIGGIGLEHLRSSENQLEPLNFHDWAGYDWDRNVLAHELVHSWNGKYRRPEKLWTPDYRRPMQDNLLWVYEGQTHFWGWVIAARSGSQTRETVLGMIASAAGGLAETPGREWRSVEDTTHDPIMASRKPKPYESLARREDYYAEGALVWLEADQVIRTGTQGRKGLEDFARAFFSAPANAGRVSTYRFEDVAAALNAVHRHDWATFLRTRIEQPGRPAPLAGIEAAGYRLVWKDEPNPYDKARMEHDRVLNLQHSLGLTLSRDGVVTGTRWGSAAFAAGIVSGAQIVAVDTVAYSAEGLKRAISEAKGSRKPIELLVKRGDRYVTVPVSYDGGLRWPWLVRASADKEAPLDRLFAPRRADAAR